LRRLPPAAGGGTNGLRPASLADSCESWPALYSAGEQVRMALAGVERLAGLVWPPGGSEHVLEAFDQQASAPPLAPAGMCS
jgi:hypothetical protein